MWRKKISSVVDLRGITRRNDLFLEFHKFIDNFHYYRDKTLTNQMPRRCTIGFERFDQSKEKTLISHHHHLVAGKNNVHKTGKR